MRILRLYPDYIKAVIGTQNYLQKPNNKCIFLLGFWDFRLFSRETDQNFIFVGTIGYGDLYLDFIVRHVKVFGLYVILHDAA